jgi:very-short-patch-repair endonuclease
MRRDRLVRRTADEGKVEFAREQRREATWSENELWQHLRRKALGLRFRRQHPIGDYVLDFYCAKAKLAVEIDGPIHEQQKGYDRARDEWLATRGIRVLRVADQEVKTDLEGVLQKIRTALDRRE